MANITANAPARPQASSRIADFVASVKERYARYRTFRTTLADLEALSERELVDLGLSRSMIRRVAYHAAYA